MTKKDMFEPWHKKMPLNEQEVEALKTLGREWQTEDGTKHYIYFDHLPDWADLTLHCRGFLLDREMTIYLFGAQLLGRVWYDFADGEFHHYHCPYFFESIVAAIYAKAASVQQGVTQ